MVINFQHETADAWDPVYVFLLLLGNLFCMFSTLALGMPFFTMVAPAFSSVFIIILLWQGWKYRNQRSAKLRDRDMIAGGDASETGGRGAAVGLVPRDSGD